jgi:hypothetical protein
VRRLALPVVEFEGLVVEGPAAHAHVDARAGFGSRACMIYDRHC